MTRTVAGSPSVLNYEEWRTSFAEFPTHVSTGRPRFATVLGRSMAMDILKSTDRPYLEGLPHEILVAILSYVSPADLARLARTCRWLSDEYAGPGLWAELEMHDRDFHAHHEVRHPAPAVVPHESRSYLREAAQLEGGFSCPETRLLNFVGALDRVWCQNRPRFRALVSRVEALCAGTMVTTRASWRTGPLIPYGITRRPLEMPDCADGNGVSPAKAAAYLVPNPRDWDHQHDLLPLLTKLQRLEIHAGWVGTGRGCKMFYDKFRGVYPADWDLDETRDWDSDGDSPNGDKSDSAPTTPPPAPLPNLRIAKLSGYVPRHIVRYVALGSAPTLERLELAVLDEPVPAAAIEARSRTRQGRPAGRCVVPRALAFTSADPESESDPGPAAAPALSFPRLRHLHLSRPSPPQPPGLGGLVGLEVSWEERCSRRAEAASLRDWARILAAVQATPVSPLAVLVLEHRPIVEQDTATFYDPSMYVPLCDAGSVEESVLDLLAETLGGRDRDAGDGGDANGGAYGDVRGGERAMEDVKGPSLRCLREVYLYGILVGNWMHQISRVAERKLKKEELERLMKKKGVRCEARRGTWCWFETTSGIADWNTYGDPDGGDYDVDEGPDELVWSI